MITSNSNHRLKSAVDLPICVLKRGDVCGWKVGGGGGRATPAIHGAAWGGMKSLLFIHVYYPCREKDVLFPGITNQSSILIISMTNQQISKFLEQKKRV